jgi:hypothetical protein
MKMPAKPATTYLKYNAVKAAGDYLWAGAGNATSAAKATIKVDLLGDVLQRYFNARGEEYDGSDIKPDDIKKAILYARGKKSSKAGRKAVLSAAQTTLQIVGTATGATVGSIVPGLGTAIGGVGGFIAGAGLSTTVTLADHIKRKGKWAYKKLAGTQGKHRAQAAKALLHCSKIDRADQRNPAREALLIILDVEYEDVVGSGNVERLADRLMSN